MNILAIDFGEANLGLAISFDGLITPKKSLKKSILKPNTRYIPEILNLCREEQVNKIIIGLPTGRLERVIKQFANQLTKVVKLPVVLYDETLTSKAAVDYMVRTGKKRSARKKKEHSIAAGLILQDYLDRLEP